MFQGSSSRSPQPPASNRRKEVREVNDSLYELYKPEGTPKIQVLFFHGLRPGLLSDAHVSTWKSADDSCIWPQEWLPDFFPGAHILSVSYSACSRNFDLYLLGENLTSDLLQGGIGQITSCPVILVGHCVGGMVIKELCCHAHGKLHSNKATTNHKEKLGKFLRNIRGVFYYSTPHHGSSGVVPAENGPLFEYLRSLYAKAERLNSEFEDVESSYKWLTFGLGASPPFVSWKGFWNCLWNILFNHSNEVEVPEASSRQGNHFLVVIANHSSICQPRSIIDKRFYHLKNLIDNIVTKFQVQEGGGPHEETRVNEAHEDQNIRQESRMDLAIPRTILSNECIYVPIQTSQDSTIEEIEKPAGAHVILLHGGVGKGKSTLARYMYERYGKDGDDSNLFEHVIWLACANCSIDDAHTKQFEVLADHSPNSFGDTLPLEKSLLNRRIAEAFQKFVGDKKILIILDDVSDPKFLYEMWKVAMRATHVKYLVTSQRSNICNSLGNDSFRIAMGVPTEKEAKAILASHVGLPNKVIPNNLEDIAKDLIKITEGNPLALACLASHFAYSQDNEDKQDKQAWQDAFRDLDELLNSPEVNIAIGNTESAPRSLWAAMKICIESLDTDDAKNLLSLIYACKGELVPEIVLRLWHTSMKTGMKTTRSPFMKSLDELRMRELVKRNSGKTAARTTDMQGMGQNDDTEQLTTMWSLRSLVKLYMQQNMVGEGKIRSLIGELLGSEESTSDLSVGWEGPCEKRRVAIALCASYFDRQHIDGTHAMTRAGIASNTTDFYDSGHDLRRKAIEPIIWMLDKPMEHGKWTQSDVQCVRKVLLTYICNRQLEDQSISHLLKLNACAPAQLATLKVIGDICFIEEKPLFVNLKLDFLQAILFLHWKEGFPTRLQEEASRTLNRICWKAIDEKLTPQIVGMPGILHVLVRSLAFSQPSDIVRAHAAGALASLAYTESVSTKLRIANQEGALVNLVKLLSAHNNNTAQEGAALALQNLATCTDNSLKLRIANHDGVLARLVKCLALYERPDLQERAANTLANLARDTDPIRWTFANEKGLLDPLIKHLLPDNNPKVQIAAARALLNLSATKDNNLQLRIANHEGVVAGLVKSLASYERPALQETIANTLANLARTDPIRLTIADEEGALSALVKLLLPDNNPEVQLAAAGALLSVCTMEDNDLKIRIANHDGVAAGLVKGLASCEHPRLQETVAKTLANLTHTDPIRWTVANEEGALNALVKLLLPETQPEVQIVAAGALLSVSATEDNHLQLRIAKQEGLVADIVKCLASCKRPDLQETLANTLANLAHTNAIRWEVANEEGALKAIVKLFSPDNNLQVQIAAARTLQSLSATEDNHLKLRIANQEGVAADVVKCLVSCKHPDLQETITNTLANLAHTDPIKWAVANEPGALHAIVKLLSPDNNPQVHIAAATALLSVSTTENNNLQLGIANHEGVIAGLVKGLAFDERPDLQEMVANTLANLAHTDPIRWAVANDEGALNALVKLLLPYNNLEVQIAAAGALLNASATKDNNLQLGIAKHEGVLAGLVKRLVSDERPDLQEIISNTLANLAHTDAVRWTIASEEGAVNALVKLLFPDNNPEVQIAAAGALLNVSATDDNNLQLHIDNQERVVADIVKCLALCERPDFQEIVVKTISNLAHIDPIRSTFAKEEGALNALVKLLLQDDKSEVQIAAAGALLSVSATEDNNLKLRIANHEGVVAGLVKGLASCERPHLQETVAKTLANLTHTDPIRWTLANEEGALNALVKLLLQETQPEVQIVAATALLSVSATEDNHLQLRIANQEGVVADIVKCLASCKRTDLQETLSNTLANVAHIDPIRWAVANDEGALNAIVKLLSPDNNPQVQIAAARALQSLSATEDHHLKLRIVNHEGVVAGLVKCLAWWEWPDLQETVANTLANLARTDPIRWTVANEEGALNALVKLLSADSKPEVQIAAAWASQCLSATNDKFLQLRIAEEEGSLEGLLKCIIAKDLPELQEYATMALANLAGTQPMHTYFLNEEGAFGSLVNLLSAQEKPAVQEHATFIYRNLAASENNSLKLRIVNEEGAMAGLVKCLARYDRPVLQKRAALSFWLLAELEEAKAIVEGTEGLLMGLSRLLADGVSAETQYVGARALTFINPTIGKEASLTSAQAYKGRAEAYIIMGMYAEALPDLGRAIDLLRGTDAESFSRRCLVKSKLGDLGGALADANEAVKVSDSNDQAFTLQERGVLKRMKGDLEGALADLDEGLKQADDYECLKHRGYVKFLLRDEDGARTDAEWALRIKPPRVDRQDYGRDRGLGVSPVEYMGYKLK